MKINKMFNECMRPHPVVHYLAGAGFMCLILNFVPSLLSNLLMLGIILLVVAFVLEFFVNPASKK